jgi:predicted RNase H-like nuclease (RuvC/YqgF family)
MSESRRITSLENDVSKINDRTIKLEEKAIKNETNINSLQHQVSEAKDEQQRCTESTEDLIKEVKAEILKEIAASENRTKDDIRRVETQLRAELGDTRKEVVKIIENDLAHIKFDVDSHIHTGDKLDLVKISGAAVGILSGVYIVIENSGAILQWLYNVLDIFF